MPNENAPPALQEGAQQRPPLLFAVTDFKVGVFDIDLGLGSE
jgi:hypothetical protein